MRISREVGSDPAGSASATPGLWRVRLPLLLTLAVLLGMGVLVTVQAWSTAMPTLENPRSPEPAPLISATPVSPATATPSLPELGDALETLYIDVEPRHWEQIEAQRQEALERWILLTSDADLVPATLRLGDETYEARVRLKGDWADHVAHDKWSLRVELRGDAYIHGMQVFSIQDPSMRTYLNEYLYLEALRDEGVLGVRYDFVRVVLNGEAKGIYAVEEGFAKELLEFQQRREGVIIRYAEDLLWEARARYDDQTIPTALERFYIIDDFGSGSVDSSPLLSAERDTAAGLLRGYLSGELTAPEVFDLGALGTFLAAVDLWSAPHGLIWHNLRYYYNPVTERLEPVAFDNDPFSPELDFESVGLSTKDLNHDPYIQAAYAQALWRMSEPGYVERLEASLGPDYERLQTALEPEFGAEVLTAPWDLLRRRQELIRQRLTPIQTAYAYRARSADVDSALPADSLVLEVGNLLDLPVEIVSVRAGDALISASADWVDEASLAAIVPPPADSPEVLVLRALPADAAALPYIHLTVPLTTSVETEVELTSRVWGLAQTFTQTAIPSYALPLAAGSRPEAPTLDEALRAHPYLRPSPDAGWLTIPAGMWSIEGSLVLPTGYGLRLGPGTTLRFGAEAFLLASGPLDFAGTAASPVTLQPQEDAWRGILALDAGVPSSWQHVTVEDTDAVSLGGWTLTGAVTFYRSPVRISYGRFLGTRAEDALNIIRTTFEIVDTEFADTASDAFDGDFTEGTLERCSFHDLGADGIDVSGSSVTVRQVRFTRLGDKGLSVGEGSQLTAEDIVVDTADFGLVSKDRSELTASRISIQGIRVAALAAYIKKPAYGPSSMTVTDIDFGDTPPEKQTLVQTRSTIDLDGQRIWGVDIDIEALYRKWQE